MKKFVLLTQTDQYNVYEVFDVIELSSDVISQRWSQIAEAGTNIVIKNTTGYENVAIGSTFDGNVFSLPENVDPTAIHSAQSGAYAFIYNGVVLGTARAFNAYIEERYQAGFSGNVFVKDVTGNENVSYGSLWNGTEFYSLPN